MTDTQERLRQYQTDHLILLVGTNPLPNYVAAKLLCPTGEVHLLCSADTQEIAENRLRKHIPNSKPVAVLRESTPQDIYTQTQQLVRDLKGSVGLHYTGGTKTMSVHAYLAVKSLRPDAVCSYLDAREFSLVVDAACPGDRDTHIPVLFEPTVKMSVNSLMDLHNISLTKEPLQTPILLQVALILKQYYERDRTWHEWCAQNLRREIERDKFRLGSELRNIRPPQEQFPELCAAFEQIGAPATNATLEDWCKVSKHFKVNSKGFTDLAKWVEGEFLESITLDTLLSIKNECRLTDCGMSYDVPRNDAAESKFEFDVAATRGYQLFAISCTTDDSNILCKSKLFEAFLRARQMGGDEARVALVCCHKDPAKLLSHFKNENFFAEGSVEVFGKDHIPDLAANLRAWINR